MRGLTRDVRALLEAGLPGAPGPIRTIDLDRTVMRLRARGALSLIANCRCGECARGIAHLRVDPLGRWLLDVDRMLRNAEVSS